VQSVVRCIFEIVVLWRSDDILNGCAKCNEQQFAESGWVFLPVLVALLEEYWFRPWVYRVLGTLGSLANCRWFCALFVGRQWFNLITGVNIFHSRIQNWVILSVPTLPRKIECGVVRPDSQTLTIFLTKICNFPVPIYDLTLNQYPVSDLPYT